MRFQFACGWVAGPNGAGGVELSEVRITVRRFGCNVKNECTLIGVASIWMHCTHKHVNVYNLHG